MRAKRNPTREILVILFASLAITFMSASCSDNDDDGSDASSLETGTLEFYANGEEFIRDGFLSKDGWQIEFDHFFVNIIGPTAIQGEEMETGESGEEKDTALVDGEESEGLISHAGHPHTGIAAGDVHAALLGDYLVDLHRTPLLLQGEPRTMLGSVEGVDFLGNSVQTGNYNTVNFNLQPVMRTLEMPACIKPATPLDAWAMAGQSIRMVGTAVKDGETVGFDIKLLPVLDMFHPEDSGIAFSSCVWESEDEPEPGLVTSGGTGWVELTFHSDHIFGDGADPDPDLNDLAPGFEPFALLAESDVSCPYDRCIEASQEELRAMWADAASEVQDLQYAYGMLIYVLGTIGHSGEGHCLH